jgi:hypothetical protein
MQPYGTKMSAFTRLRDAILVLHEHMTDIYIYSYILRIEKLVQVSTQDGVSHKSTKCIKLLQYKNTVICIQYSNVIVNPLHTGDNRKLR